MADAIEAVLVTHLLDLEGDVLLCILAFLDEQSLTRTRATCRALLPLAQTPMLWMSALVRFFDGELPPELAPCDDPRAVLREQVEFARALTAKERTARCFQVPIVPFPNRKSWSKELDSRVAEAQIRSGQSIARPGMPYYGCSGGAYSTSTACYGRFVKATHQNCVAARMLNEADATRVIWMHRTEPEPPPEPPAEPTAEPTAEQTAEHARMLIAGCDYGPLARWVDDKRIELATTAGAPHLAERLVSERDAAEKASFYQPQYGQEDVNPQADKPRSLSASQLSLPRLLCGFYGGLFSANVTGTSIGTIYGIHCKDNTSCADYSDM